MDTKNFYPQKRNYHNQENTNTMNTFHVHKNLAQRYVHMMDRTHNITTDDNHPFSLHNLRWMCNTIIEHGETWPIDKVGRWLGYIQAGMIMHELTSVNTERDFSRPLFHAAYKEQGQTIPPTREAPTKT